MTWTMLAAILIYAGWLYASLQLLGGAYLLVLAWRIWRGAAAPVQDTRNVGRTNILASLLVALGTQLSNPKTALVYAGLFAALLPPETPPALLAVLLPAILVVETGWYLVVALLFSAEAPRLLYLKGKKWVDRTAAAVMGLLGLRLMASSLARPWLTPAAG
jgi:threonine/homoserine/homoserine lactone efflux protein